MPLAMLSPEAQINKILSELDCATSNFAPTVGTLSASRVAAALSGQNDFAATDGEFHLKVAREMQRLANEVDVPVDWRKVEKVRLALASRRKAEPMQRIIPFHIVRFSDGSMFQKMSNGQPVRTSNYTEAAAIGRFETASAITRLLTAMGHRCGYTSITNMRRSDIFDRVADFGFEEAQC